MAHWFTAYVDPGAGSLIVQAAITSVVAVPVCSLVSVGNPNATIVLAP